MNTIPGLCERFFLLAGSLLLVPWCGEVNGAMEPAVTTRENLRRMEARERAAELEYRKRAFPLTSIPPGAMDRGLEQIGVVDREKWWSKDGGIYTWFTLGPAPIFPGTNGNRVPQSGRVPALAVDPSDSAHWLVGAAQGGIWETTNQGGFWSPRTDDQASLAMGAIAFATTTPTLVYAGTGEPNFSRDSYAGRGLLISHDGGTTWQMVNSMFSESSFSHIVVDPAHGNNLAVSTVRGVGGIVAAGTNIPPAAPARGVFISDNFGAMFSPKLIGEATALAMNPGQFRLQYAGLGEIIGAATNGVYRTTNTWITWDRINGPWTSVAAPTELGRVAIAVSRMSSSTVYVGVAFKRDSLQGNLAGIWRTDNAWDSNPSWTQVPPPSVGPFLWYSFDLIVDPSDSGVLYLAEFDVQRFENGSWTSVGGNVHVDQHVMAWLPWGFGSYRMLLGNDGGIFRSSTYPPNGSWVDVTANMSITQIYKGSVDRRAASVLALAGTQDNGTAVNTNKLAWRSLQGGDGCDNAISASDPDHNWAFSFETDQNLEIIHLFRTLDGGQTSEDTTSGIDTDAFTPFFAHFEKSPFNDDLFIAGTDQLWLCTNYFSGVFAEWSSNSPVMLGNNSGVPVPISAMAFAPSDTNGTIYAFGTEDGQLRITANAGALWTELDPTNGVPDRYITGLAFSPVDPNVLYVTVSGFDEGTPGQPGHVFKTANALSAMPGWVDVSPPVNLPMNCLVINATNAGIIFVGSDVGVWSSPNGGAGWTHHGPGIGMPNVAVFDIRMNSAGQPTAFTHGRGAFTYALAIPQVVVDGPITPQDIACLNCPPINWVNPGDLVSVELPLHNVLPPDTVDLVATMLPSAEITPLEGTQDYGVLHGQGASLTKRFAFRANLTTGPGPSKSVSCGDTVQVIFHLQDQTNDLGVVSIPFRLGSPSHPLSEDFERVPVGAVLPPGWDSVATGPLLPWTVTTNMPPNFVPVNTPDDPIDLPGPYDGPPNSSAYTPAAGGVGQSLLITPALNVATASAQLYFQQAFKVADTFDGCILEIAIGTQPFREITLAGGSFVMNGYNRILNDRNPLGPRPAWSGNTGGWLPVLLNLPATAAGQQVQLRWNFATSMGLPDGFWFIDSAGMTEPLCLPPVSNPVILNPTLRSTGFSFDISTVNSRVYVIEFKTDLADPVWQYLESVVGDGTVHTITAPVTSAGQSFYRFFVQ